MKRGQAITLLTDLCLKEKLVQPTSVIIEHREPDAYQLKLKITGDYDRELIKKFVQKKNFSVEEEKDKEHILIF